MYNYTYIHVHILSILKKNHHQNLVSTECTKIVIHESIENVSGFKGSDFDFYFLCVAMANNIMHVIYYFNCLPNWA